MILISSVYLFNVGGSSVHKGRVVHLNNIYPI
ncbi:hypothetical protein Maeo_1035 [Methanococcus aeolicus Nankai-3]|uniref:Uncharacterized protein n=1 Tax=Methanococcus aeolicus (strain ATCC BAA-1280 / DSM 17508 / OCM 812 / Nankai-3) TaxID=419665 RepID=A6UVU1_META3|nr:hypothetical protein Maeo_1035 [Methanococcus aeolicus Nankai-3]